MKNVSLSVFLTAAVYCCSLLPGLAQTVRNETQPSASTDTDSFLAKAIEANAAEIELGKMAESKSENPRVRAFAEMMVKDHTNVLNALHRLATGGITAFPNGSAGTDAAQLPTGVTLSKERQQLRDRLSQLNGDDFDREYMNAMIQEHRKDIRQFEREANSASDTSRESTKDSSGYIREKPQTGTDSTNVMTPEKIIARDLLPILKMHLQHAEALEREVGNIGIPQNNSGAEAPTHMKTQ